MGLLSSGAGHFGLAVQRDDAGEGRVVRGGTAQIADVQDGGVTHDGDSLGCFAGIVSPFQLHAGLAGFTQLVLQAADVVLGLVAIDTLAGHGVLGCHAGDLVVGKALVVHEEVLLVLGIDGFLDGVDAFAQGSVLPGAGGVGSADGYGDVCGGVQVVAHD